MNASKLRIYILLMGALALCAGLAGDVYADHDSVKSEGLYNATSKTTVQSPPPVPPPIQITQAVSVCNAVPDPQSYRLGPDDVLRIGVFGEADLSGKYTLGNTGAIAMPLIGEVALLGCSLDEARRVIYQKYTDGYLIDPSISIEISTYRPFFIVGEVRAPGRYDFSVGMTGLKAAALAGGFTYRANRKTAQILRNKYQGAPKYETQKIEKKIQPGDVVLIKERLF